MTLRQLPDKILSVGKIIVHKIENAGNVTIYLFLNPKKGALSIESTRACNSILETTHT